MIESRVVGGCSGAALTLGMLLAAAADSATAGEPVPYLRAPTGFRVEYLVADLPNARSMVFGSKGTLFVGARSGGAVSAVIDPFGARPEVVTIARGLSMPNGVAFRDGDLYIAEPQRILRLADVEKRLRDPGAPEPVITGLPYKNAAHAWKYIAFGPDGKLYVPFGAPCNVCDENGFAAIYRMNADGTERELVARGVRNTVGFAWHPVTRELWFTDNGRDMLGDEVPPCELNRVSRVGQHFGFPFCHGGDIADPSLGNLGKCGESEPPVQKLGPHVAPLGMKFYTGNMFPPRYRGQALIAEHGSWNRSKAAGRTGYRVTMVELDGNRAIGYQPFIEGWLDGDTVHGQPVDLLVAPDGSLLISDDKRGAIYRVTYAPAAAVVR